MLHRFRGFAGGAGVAGFFRARTGLRRAAVGLRTCGLALPAETDRCGPDVGAFVLVALAAL